MNVQHSLMFHQVAAANTSTYLIRISSFSWLHTSKQSPEGRELLLKCSYASLGIVLFHCP